MPEPIAEEEAPKKKKKKLKVIVPVLVLVIGLGGGGFFFMSSSKKADADPNATTTTIPGPTVPLNAITTNLSDGHILKVGISLQLSAKPKEKELAAFVAAAASAEHGSGDAPAYPLGGVESKALDITISVLGNDTYAHLSAPGGRDEAKKELAHQIEEAYEGDITNVYFTQFVMS